MSETNGSAYGDLCKLCQTIAAKIADYRWDNMTISEQRDWVIRQHQLTVEAFGVVLQLIKDGQLHPKDDFSYGWVGRTENLTAAIRRAEDVL